MSYGVRVSTSPKVILEGMERKLELYTRMYHACFLPATTQTLNVRGDLRLRRLSIKECVRKRAMLKKPVNLLLKGVEKAQVEDLLEYGLRLATEISDEIEWDLELARKVFTLVLDNTSFPAKERAIAANCILHLKRTYYFADDDEHDCALQYFELAERSCEYGLFTHTCFQLAIWGRDHLQREKPFCEYRNFWWEWEVFQEETGIQRHRSRQCAVCGFSPGIRMFLRQCGGKCPKAKKPVYCDRRCQRLDWSNHRKWCRIETRQRYVTDERHF